MKKQIRNDRKLALRTETICTLKTLDLANVAGGQVTTTVLSVEKKCASDIC